MSIHPNVFAAMTGLSALMLIAAMGTVGASDSRAELQGVWRTIEVVVPGPTPQTFKPAATLAIFHGTHYSRVEVHADTSRPALGDPAKASADELRAAWGPFFGEAGTFDVSGDGQVTMHASVAKNPAAMSNGATTVYSYSRTADTLTLTQIRTPSGASPRVQITLARVE